MSASMNLSKHSPPMAALTTATSPKEISFVPNSFSKSQMCQGKYQDSLDAPKMFKQYKLMNRTSIKKTHNISPYRVCTNLSKARNMDQHNSDTIINSLNTQKAEENIFLIEDNSSLKSYGHHRLSNFTNTQFSNLSFEIQNTEKLYLDTIQKNHNRISPTNTDSSSQITSCSTISGSESTPNLTLSPSFNLPEYTTNISPDGEFDHNLNMSLENTNSSLVTLNSNDFPQSKKRKFQEYDTAKLDYNRIKSTGSDINHEIELKKLRSKPATNFGMLELLCSVSIQVCDKMNEPEITCSCPRSRCIKLYCECFQTGKMCSQTNCSCKKCKNTKEENGPNGIRTRAIQNIISRNPYAFDKDKSSKKSVKSVGLVCRCVKSRCLKLYCECFQSGKVCNNYCMCIKCENTHAESGKGGKRTYAKKMCLERNPDAFSTKIKKTGEGCACKNSRCLKKYCDCFNSGIECSEKCICIDCYNMDLVKKTIEGQFINMNSGPKFETFSQINFVSEPLQK